VLVIFFVYFKRFYDNLLYVKSFSSLNLVSNSESDCYTKYYFNA